jgi:hypothetical protein
MAHEIRAFSLIPLTGANGIFRPSLTPLLGRLTPQASAGASATLIGLLFIAVSVGAERVFGGEAPAEHFATATSASFRTRDALFHQNPDRKRSFAWFDRGML